MLGSYSPKESQEIPGLSSMVLDRQMYCQYRLHSQPTVHKISSQTGQSVGPKKWPTSGPGHEALPWGMKPEQHRTSWHLQRMQSCAGKGTSI